MFPRVPRVGVERQFTMLQRNSNLRLKMTTKLQIVQLNRNKPLYLGIKSLSLHKKISTNDV